MLLQSVDLGVGEVRLAELAVALLPELVGLLGKAVGYGDLNRILEQVGVANRRGLKLLAHEHELDGRVLGVLLVVPAEMRGEEREIGLPVEQGGVFGILAALLNGLEVLEAR